MRWYRALRLATLGTIDEVVREIEAGNPAAPDAQGNAAGSHQVRIAEDLANLVEAVARGRSWDILDPLKEQPSVKALSAKALACLQQAWTDGYRDLPHVLVTNSFDILRALPDYRPWIESLPEPDPPVVSD